MTNTVREYTTLDFINWASDIEVTDWDFFFLYFQGSKLKFSERWLVVWFFLENPAVDLLALCDGWGTIQAEVLAPFEGVYFDSGAFDWALREVSRKKQNPKTEYKRARRCPF
jgi:hypothetical protein